MIIKALEQKALKLRQKTFDAFIKKRRSSPRRKFFNDRNSFVYL